MLLSLFATTRMPGDRGKKGHPSLVGSLYKGDSSPTKKERKPPTGQLGVQYIYIV